MFAKITRVAIALGIAALASVAAYFTRDRWLPLVTLGPRPSAEEHEDKHAGASTSIVLSEQARKNLGLRLGPVKVTDYWRSITVPGSVIERPGHSHRKVNAPLAGIVQNIHVHQNQMVMPGDPLIDLALTGESLASVQSGLLRTLRDIEVNTAELDRLAPLVAEGSVPAKKRLDVDYERRRLESQRETAIQELQVLGMSKRQVDEVLTTKKMLREFVVRAPAFSADDKMHVDNAQVLPGQKVSPDKPAIDWTYTVETIDVYPGRQVQVGDEMSSLAFHSLLYVEGQAFEKEGEIIAKAMVEKWPVKARFEVGGNADLVRDDLRILYLDNVVDPATRTFHFILPLPNEVLHDSRGSQDEIYRSWRFKPGQRVQLQVPIERMRDRVVLPAEAVVREGPDAFIFVADGNAMNRQSVQVEFEGAGVAVIANDGSVYAGDTVAMNNAYQLNLAVKKASGSGVDPHAGHSH